MRRLKILTWHIHGSYLNTMAQIDHFLFSPMRYTSLPLAVIENGVSGYVPCNVDELIERMRFLLTAPDEARRLGANARASARARFGLERFIRDWNAAFASVVEA